MAIAKSKKTTIPIYSTSDQYMIQALLMMGHQPINITMDIYQRQVVYEFDEADTADSIEKILLRPTDITITLSQWWNAQNVWAMNLRHHMPGKRE